MSDVTDIVRETAEKVGTTVDRAWPLYIKWVWADAMAPMIVCIAVLALICAVWAVLWRVANRVDDIEGAAFMRIIPGVIFLLITLVSSIIVSNNLASALAPEGAAIHAIVVRVAK